MDLEEARSAVVELLEANARWRERTARRYRDDPRNLDAAEESFRLAEEMAALPVEDFLPFAELEEQFWAEIAQNEGEEDDDEGEDEREASPTERRLTARMDRQNVLLRSLGFHYFPADARELLDRLVAVLGEAEGTADDEGRED